MNNLPAERDFAPLNLFNEIISLENLFLAWKEFRRGKRKKPDVQLFERDLEDNLFRLHRELVNQTYRHGNYSSFYVTDPKLRLIHKACVRDRVLHHAIYQILYPIFDKSFIHDSYSCRLKKGTHKAVERLEYFTRKVSKNYSRKCFVLKCDVKKFFASVDHEILFLLLKSKIQDENLRKLLQEIINSFSVNSRESFWLSAKGIPIGNLTSQLFANIYLDQLDNFIKHNLRIKFYIRYTDDFVIVDDDQLKLNNLILKINYLLENKLKLGLHPDKVNICNLGRGIDFLGYVVLPYYRVLRTKTKNRMLKKINQKNIASYLGLLKHCSNFKLSRRLPRLAASQ